MSVIVNGTCLNENDCFLIASILKANAKNWRTQGSKSKDFGAFFQQKAEHMEQLSEHFFAEGIAYKSTPKE